MLRLVGEQKLKGSLRLVAKVIIVDEESTQKYRRELNGALQDCQNLQAKIKEMNAMVTSNEGVLSLEGKVPDTQSASNSQVTQAKSSISNLVINQHYFGSQLGVPKTQLQVEGETKESSSPKYFSEYPEALHEPDEVQCTRFNQQLMRKLVVEKKRRNPKFIDSKLMNDVFKFYPQQTFQRS
uniref:Uncharacterized protein n=1 Tax=Strombidium rassoulzadegani TaxID=1082188 RepID=A0A7S3CNJ6_9SPIT|mmetsp:Transcript_18760/g.32063  ORF Transcript_18760/g.32063 Transcript_18760/m.32063 type:complete len:182 (+) Transcript_18760:74-619(+)|eukprot:CAMPEP_0168621020 /NCGR_PEP_ID=MMETSP0449_2-20121227/7460_1 /TAXON_ID=1082188 /ORGANISM="Strombidium rassoulzadegani, Strain ras09" /LENGTH=181 /DNA_ID=CAMNT_0008662089 /DNA_START=128 /DNA_END=673 /DNA_ORIENTATION=+